MNNIIQNLVSEMHSPQGKSTPNNPRLLSRVVGSYLLSYFHTFLNVGQFWNAKYHFKSKQKYFQNVKTKDLIFFLFFSRLPPF